MNLRSNDAPRFLVACAVAITVLHTCALLTSCKPVEPSPESAEITAYGYEQGQCIDNASTKEDADTCRARVKAKYCALWKAADAGVNCNLDGGAP